MDKKDRLAQPEQLITPGGGLPNDHNGVTAAQPDQEPVAWRFYDGGMWCYVDHLTDLPQNKFEPLYTAPTREWQGLTVEEIEAAGKESRKSNLLLPYSFARAIEAKLKEKNNG